MKSTRRLIAWALLPGALFMSGCVTAGLLGYRVNTTLSLPMGIWREATTAEHSAYVTFCLPDAPFARDIAARGYIPHGLCPVGLAPLLKPVAAVAGDTVDVMPDGIAVNGRRVLNTAPITVDSLGRPLAAYPTGRYTVAPGQFWVISTQHPRSLDSRYFGPVPVSSVQTAMAPVYTFNPLGDKHATVHR